MFNHGNCGCGNGCNDILWLILLLCCCGGGGDCGCGNGCYDKKGCDCCDFILLYMLINCLGCGCGNGCCK